MLPGICIILLFYAFGECIALLTGRLIPGSVIGMVLLFAALCTGIVKPEKVRPVARFLTDNMGLFFLPAGVGIVNATDMLSQHWQAVLTACAVSTVAVIVTVACTQEWLEKRQGKRNAAAGTPPTGTGRAATAYPRPKNTPETGTASGTNDKRP